MVHQISVVEEEQFTLTKNYALSEQEIKDLADSLNAVIDKTETHVPHIEFKNQLETHQEKVEDTHGHVLSIKDDMKKFEDMFHEIEKEAEFMR